MASGADRWLVETEWLASHLETSLDRIAVANPNPLTVGSTSQLSVLGADDGGENNLIYTWAALGSPPGPAHGRETAGNPTRLHGMALRASSMR